MSKVHRTGHSLQSKMLCDQFSHPEVLLVLPPRGGRDDTEEGCNGQALTSVTQTPAQSRFVPLPSQGPILHLSSSLDPFCSVSLVVAYPPPLLVGKLEFLRTESSFKEVCSDKKQRSRAKRIRAEELMLSVKYLF